MNDSIHDADAANEYQRCVDNEREAWAAMHRLAAGSTERAEAFREWSEAISRTNAAWRRFHAGHAAAAAAQPVEGHA